MNRFKLAAAGLVSVGSLIALTLSPAAFAESRFIISGNGFGSDSNISADITKEVRVEQSNESRISNNIHAVANTGGVSASGNNGGDVSVHTGNANSRVEINNAANLNHANLSGCDCDNDGLDVSIEDNGALSQSLVEVNKAHIKDVLQHNNSDIDNNVHTVAQTGGTNASSSDDEDDIDGFDHHNFSQPFINHDFDNNFDNIHHARLLDRDIFLREDFENDNDDNFDDEDFNNDNGFFENHHFDLSRIRDDNFNDEFNDEDFDDSDFDNSDLNDEDFVSRFDFDNNDSDFNNDFFDRFDLGFLFDDLDGANFNNGGDVSVNTGDATSDVLIRNMANANFLHL